MGTGEEEHLTDTGAHLTDRCDRTIIMPAYNEENRIGPVLEEYLQYFNDGTEMMVLLNGCRDNTREIVCKFIDDYPNLRVVEETGDIGKGGALILGFRLARGDLIGYVDADGSTAPRDMDRLMGSIGDYDSVIGSRWMDKSVMRVKQSFYRRFASRVFNLIVRIMFRISYRDIMCGAKAFTRQAVEAIVDQLGTTNVAFDVDVLYVLKINGFTTEELPLAWEHKPGSKFSPRKEAPRAFGALVRIKIKHSRFKNLVK